ncbi:hypothetical protein [Pseudomonas sp. 2FE]|nr:hypothetical protein [Pseudomonas sp. 2FE]
MATVSGIEGTNILTGAASGDTLTGQGAMTACAVNDLWSGLKLAIRQELR